MDAVTLALAKAYTNANRLAYESEEKVVINSDNGGELPFSSVSDLVGMNVVDFAEGRHILATPTERPTGGNNFNFYHNSSTWSLAYTTNNILNKPILIFRPFGATEKAYMSPILTIETGYDSIVYAYESTSDTMGAGVTLGKGWHLVNSTTFANKPLDIDKYPVFIYPKFVKTNDVKRTDFPDQLALAETWEFEVKAENIVSVSDDSHYVHIAPVSARVDGYASFVFNSATGAVTLTMAFFTTEAMPEVTIKWEGVHKIDPKYLPEGALPVVELSEETSTALFSGSSVSFTEVESAQFDAAASEATPVVVKMSMGGATLMAVDCAYVNEGRALFNGVVPAVQFENYEVSAVVFIVFSFAKTDSGWSGIMTQK